MSKIRFVRCDYLSLKRYYAPVVIELDVLRRMLPTLPENEAEAEIFLRQNPERMVDFLKWYYPDDSGTVTDPKGKGRDWPESIGLEEVKLQTENDSGWRWLFSNFPEVGEETLKDFCDENDIAFQTPKDKQRILMERFQEFLSEFKETEISSFDARNLFEKMFPTSEDSIEPQTLYSLLVDSDLEKVQIALDYLEKELKTPASIEIFFGFTQDDLEMFADHGDIFYALEDTIQGALVDKAENIRKDSRLFHLEYLALWLLGHMAALRYSIPLLDEEDFLLSENTRLDCSNRAPIAYSGLSGFPATLQNLKSITILDVSNNPLTELPEYLDGLSELNISGTQIKKLPPNIESLRLDAEQLEMFKEILPTLANLKILDLRDQGLTSLPEELAQCSHIKELYLSNNQLTEIPDSIQNLPNLTRLDVKDNPLKPSENQKILQLTDDSWDKTLQKAEAILKNIEVLDLRDGDFGSIDTIFPHLLKCTSAKTLHLQGNPIIKLPRDFFRIFQKGLFIDAEGKASYSLIVNVDSDLRKQLHEQLYFALKNSDSQFRSQIKILDFQGFQLKTFLDFAGSFPNLEEINLTGVPLSKRYTSKFRHLQSKGVKIIGLR